MNDTRCTRGDPSSGAGVEKVCIPFLFCLDVLACFPVCDVEPSSAPVALALEVSVAINRERIMRVSFFRRINKRVMHGEILHRINPPGCNRCPELCGRRPVWWGRNSGRFTDLLVLHAQRRLCLVRHLRLVLHFWHLCCRKRTEHRRLLSNIHKKRRTTHQRHRWVQDPSERNSTPFRGSAMRCYHRQTLHYQEV